MSPPGLAIKFALLGLVLVLAPSSYARDATRLYQDHCAECHNQQRLGAMGPALLPGNLKRLRKPAAIDVISNGRIATQMPGFGDKLSPQDIEALVEFIYTPSAEPVVWGLPEITASRIIHNRAQDLSEQPVFAVDDPLNLFLVV